MWAYKFFSIFAKQEIKIQCYQDFIYIFKAFKH